MKLHVEPVSFPLERPFVITGYRFDSADTVQVRLQDGEFRGRGEGMGMYYHNETQQSMASQLEQVASAVEAGASREAVQDLLPAGGALNALDCALWDLEAKRACTSVWELLNLRPKPLTTVCTIGIDTPEAMAELARQYRRYSNLKIKLSDDAPIERLEAIRKARPDAVLVIDVNQGWSIEQLREYAPAAKRLGIAMIEQPLKRGEDEALEGYVSPVPLGADESCLDAEDYARVARYYSVINIKLDKCGGLTQALKLVQLAQQDSKALMVGNMTGSSLSMAPAFVVGQFCQFVDIDGALLLAQDIDGGLDYGEGGVVGVPSPSLWG
ncbi:dipeptide epimerase [Parahaliea maris]|uniref:Dipeptide epimerase n=1 Tax=Parahaliea maris TaxID=2716870 RepID=A0A5C8ZQT1_9GAMM|nr:dipeptide epimerase [Parahaliea maris]TXS90818.1 dipeptide epimerase [Parahaliea maris]